MTRELQDKEFEIKPAEEKDTPPASFALFFHNFSTFLGKPGLYLEDLFVKPEFSLKYHTPEV